MNIEFSLSSQTDFGLSNLLPFELSELPERTGGFFSLSDACPEEVGIGGEGWGEEALLCSAA